MSSLGRFARMVPRSIMEITYLGHSSFKLKGRQTSLVTDPFDSSMVGLRYPKVEAEIVTVSHDHKDHNYTQGVFGIRKVVSGPGEYEIAGVSIVGIAAFHDNKEGSIRGKNTLYLIEMDGLRLVHLGDLGHRLNDKLVTEIGEVDILFIPVGGEYTIGPLEAAEVVVSLAPKIVIPMHYHVEGLKADVFAKLAKVDSFVTQTGLKSEILPKLSIKKEDLVDETKIIILERH